MARPALAHPHPFRAALALPVRDVPSASLADDLKLFLTAWAGGVVFFGTLLA